MIRLFREEVAIDYKSDLATIHWSEAFGEFASEREQAEAASRCLPVINGLHSRITLTVTCAGSLIFVILLSAVELAKQSMAMT